MKIGDVYKLKKDMNAKTIAPAESPFPYEDAPIKAGDLVEVDNIIEQDHTLPNGTVLNFVEVEFKSQGKDAPFFWGSNHHGWPEIQKWINEHLEPVV